MQVTIRGIDPDLAQILKRLSREEGISLNKAALRLLARGAGLDREPARKRKRTIGHDLDHLFGTWTDSETEAFLDAIGSCGQIDEGFWK
jgi:hypothetical protein